MTVVTVYDRNNVKRLQLEPMETETIMNIKTMLCKDDPQSVCLTCKGKLLSDATPLHALGESVELLLESEIELKQIGVEEQLVCPGLEFVEKDGQLPREGGLKAADILGTTEGTEAAPNDGRLDITLNGQRMTVQTSDTFTLNGKLYYITKRTRRFSFQYIKKEVMKLLNRVVIMQLLVLLLLLHTNNLFILIVILMIRVLKMTSRTFQVKALWKYVQGHAAKTTFMFVASMFLIDHPRFFKELPANSE